MSRIVTEMGHGGTMTAMTEEETATGIAMMTGTAETTIEEVGHGASVDLVLGFRSTVQVIWLPDHKIPKVFLPNQIIGLHDSLIALLPP